MFGFETIWCPNCWPIVTNINTPVATKCRQPTSRFHFISYCLSLLLLLLLFLLYHKLILFHEKYILIYFMWQLNIYCKYVFFSKCHLSGPNYIGPQNKIRFGPTTATIFFSLLCDVFSGKIFHCRLWLFFFCLTLVTIFFIANAILTTTSSVG